jgi:hypothetical protein
MNIAILEIAPNGHYTYVESIAKIYTAVEGNHISIFTTEKGEKALKHIENQYISVAITGTNETGLNKIASQNFDKLFVITLEAYFKEPYRIMTIFEKIDFNCPIYYVIHNIDFWFQQSLSTKFRNIFYQLNNFNDFIYRLKIYFKYSSINPRILKKVENSGGSFVTLTDNVANELRQYTPSVFSIPFSVFDESITDNSLNNTKLRVCLPGYVSTSRRNYDVILDILEGEKSSQLKELVEWDFLGGISKSENGESIVKRAKALKTKGYSINIYDKPSVGLQEFDDNLSKADIVLGNLHLQQGLNLVYGKTKESGLIFTMIKAAKPGIVPFDYALEKTLESSILTFENYNELPEILLKLSQNQQILKDLKQKALVNSKKYTPLSIYKAIEKIKS